MRALVLILLVACGPTIHGHNQTASPPGMLPPQHPPTLPSCAVANAPNAVNCNTEIAR